MAQQALNSQWLDVWEVGKKENQIGLSQSFIEPNITTEKSLHLHLVCELTHTGKSYSPGGTMKPEY